MTGPQRGSAHLPRLENDVAEIVVRPVPVDDSAFPFHCVEQRRAGKRRQDGRLEGVDPRVQQETQRPLEHVGRIPVGAEDEAGVHGDAGVVKLPDRPCVVAGA